MVDRAALEMQCTARYRGFESLPLRQTGSPFLSSQVFAACFAQESFRVTVRLKTGAPGLESLASAQK